MGDGISLFNLCLDDHIIPLLQSISRDDVPILHVVIGIVNQSILRIIIDTLTIF